MRVSRDLQARLITWAIFFKLLSGLKGMFRFG